MISVFIGIDPGQSGGIAVVAGDTTVASLIYKMPDTEADLTDLFEKISGMDANKINSHTYIEKVHSMPAQGVVSSFKFGYNFGLLVGMLAAHKLPYTFVTPQKWQKELGCMTKGDKNVSKKRAQELFPTLKITHAVADALLIAEYGRRTYK